LDVYSSDIIVNELRRFLDCLAGAGSLS